MEDLTPRVEEVLKGVRPYLARDGGNVRQVRILPEGILEVAWEGTCRICPMSRLTLRAGVERVIMKEIPQIRRVEAVAG
ncbi:MAG: NifU family protein [Bacteroidota bacterium]